MRLYKAIPILTLLTLVFSAGTKCSADDPFFGDDDDFWHALYQMDVERNRRKKEERDEKRDEREVEKRTKRSDLMQESRQDADTRHRAIEQFTTGEVFKDLFQVKRFDDSDDSVPSADANMQPWEPDDKHVPFAPDRDDDDKDGDDRKDKKDSVLDSKLRDERLKRADHWHEFTEPRPLIGDWAPAKVDPLTNSGFTIYPDNGRPVPYRLNGHVDEERKLPWLDDDKEQQYRE